MQVTEYVLNYWQFISMYTGGWLSSVVVIVILSGLWLLSRVQSFSDSCAHIFMCTAIVGVHGVGTRSLGQRVRSRVSVSDPLCEKFHQVDK